MKFFGEETFIEEMNSVGAKFRDEHYEEGEFLGCDFSKLHYVMVKHKNERAAVVISHGFCEFARKFDELIYYFYELGFSVYFVEHRGHGFSQRFVEDEGMVHATRFYDYIDDMKCFMDMVVKKNSPSVPCFMYAHSMGGAIAAGFLEEYPGYVDAAVLSSPMMEMSLGKVPRFVVMAIADVKRFFKKGKKYAPGNHGFDDCYVFKTSGALSESRYRYCFELREQVPEYRTYGGSYDWLATALRAQSKIVRRANRIKIPVRLYQAGLDTKVNSGGQDRFVKNAGIEKVLYPDSKHEIFNASTEMREAYFQSVFDFFEDNLKDK